MAFKVKILSVLLFICLIDSLHSASNRRFRRAAEEEPATPDKEEPDTPDKESPDTPDKGSPDTPDKGSPDQGDKGGESGGGAGGKPPLGPIGPIDVNVWVDRFGQFFKVPSTPEWVKFPTDFYSQFLGGGKN